MTTPQAPPPLISAGPTALKIPLPFPERASPEQGPDEGLWAIFPLSRLLRLRLRFNALRSNFSRLTQGNLEHDYWQGVHASSFTAELFEQHFQHYWRSRLAETSLRLTEFDPEGPDFDALLPLGPRGALRHDFSQALTLPRPSRRPQYLLMVVSSESKPAAPQPPAGVAEDDTATLIVDTAIDTLREVRARLEQTTADVAAAADRLESRLAIEQAREVTADLGSSVGRLTEDVARFADRLEARLHANA